ncbi:preprotein translocase subunit SecG [Oscillospiraceae bacterium DSM 107454]|uniref:Protein-export membrane protein SecG n=1 Tax=Ructibacterium gallinarum TaxID=2779355 RepID=A0A9D5R9F9_9FIRM|nr:preprotein translocase subunit SecG [Ructibacterium gallinarum]
MMIALTIIHVIISLALIVVVLLQHGKQQGLSGAIAGGAETFFGKNKGRTVDAMLKKFTAVVAILFIVSSITFAAMAINVYNQTNAENEAAQTTEETGTDAAGIDATSQLTMDENGNMVDAEGNIIMTADQIAQQQAEAENAETGTAADADTASEADAGADANAEAPEASAAADASAAPAASATAE